MPINDSYNSDLTYIAGIKMGISNFTHHLFKNMTTILNLAILLIIINTILLINYGGQNLIEHYSSKVDIILNIDSDIKPEQKNQFEAYIKAMKEVKSYKVVSSTEALNTLSTKYPEEVEILKQLKLQNPLPLTFQIKTNSVKDYDIIMNNIENSPYINLIDQKYTKETSLLNDIQNKYKDIYNIVYKFFFLLISIFTVLIIFIIINNIVSSIYLQKHELEIIQLIGAKYNFLHLPLITEGIINSVLASIIAFIIQLSLIFSLTNTEAIVQNLFQGFSTIKVLSLELCILIAIWVIIINLIDKHKVNFE